MMLTSPERLQAFTISITPFDQEGKVDEPAFRAHLRRLCAAGIGVYVGGGGSGEGYTLSEPEADRLLAIAVDELKGIVPVRAMGVEPRTAREMVDFLRRAELAGVDAAQVYSLDIGHGHAPTARELERYFEEVLDNTKMKLILSTHQSVGYVIPASVIIGLFQRHRHIVGINISHPEPDYIRTLIDAVGGRADICVGGPHLAAMALALGAQGFLTSEGNLAPKLVMSVIAAVRTGDSVAFFDSLGRLLRLSLALYGNGGIRVTKAVLNRLGAPGGYPRLPRLPADDGALARAMEVVEVLGIRQIEGL